MIDWILTLIAIIGIVMIGGKVRDILHYSAKADKKLAKAEELNQLTIDLLISLETKLDNKQ